MTQEEEEEEEKRVGMTVEDRGGVSIMERRGHAKKNEGRRDQQSINISERDLSFGQKKKKRILRGTN